MATDLVSFVLPTILPAAEVLVIVAAYSTIRYFRQADPSLSILVGTIGLVTLLILKLGITNAVHVTEASTYFIETGLKMNKRRMKYIQLYLKSCRPLQWRIGGTFALNCETFPRIADGIIINILIHLFIVF